MALDISMFFGGRSPEVNPLFGNVHQVGDKWFNSQGEDITSQVEKFGTGPVKNPSFWNRAFNPAAARQAGEINAKYALTPAMREQEFSIEKSQGIQRAKQFLSFNQPDKYPTPTDVPDDYALKAYMAMGGQVDPTAMNVARRSIVAGTRGVPETEGETDALEAKYKRRQAEGMLNRQTIQEKIWDEKAVNDFSTVTGVDPKQIQLTIKQLEGELSREPTRQEVLTSALNLQKEEQELTGEKLKAEKRLLPTELSTADLVAMGKNIGAQFPLGLDRTSPFAHRLNPTGELVRESNPAYVSSMDKVEEMMKGEGAETPVTLSSGEAVSIPQEVNKPASLRSLVVPGATGVSSNTVPTTATTAVAAPAVTPQQSIKPTVSFGPSVSGEPEGANVNYGMASKKEALANLGFFIDSQGRMQRLPQMPFLAPIEDVNDPRFKTRAATALKIANSPYLK